MKGYKTLFVNILTAAVAVLGYVPPDQAEWALPTLAVVNILLRLVTDGPVPAVSIRRTFVVPLVGVLALGAAASQLVGCATTGNQCLLLEQVLAGRRVALEAKCAQAPDPLTDDKCLYLDGMNAAVALCYAGQEFNVPPAPSDAPPLPPGVPELPPATTTTTLPHVSS